MKAHVDQGTCIGCELCPSICPDIFQMRDDGFAHVTTELVPADLQDCAREAAESCPVDAILLD